MVPKNTLNMKLSIWFGLKKLILGTYDKLNMLHKMFTYLPFCLRKYRKLNREFCKKEREVGKLIYFNYISL
jgi:hypothetical protein